MPTTLDGCHAHRRVALVVEEQDLGEVVEDRGQRGMRRRDLAEVATEGDVLCLSDVLLAEEDHFVLDQRHADGRDGHRVEWL